MASVSFQVVAFDLASRVFREIGREALEMALKVKAANAAMDSSFLQGTSEFKLWLKAIILGLPLIPPLIVAVGQAAAGLNSVMTSTLPGIGILIAALAANFARLKEAAGIDKLRVAWREFGNETATVSMRILGESIRILIGLLERAAPIARAFGEVLVTWLRNLRLQMEGPAFDKFLNWVRTVGAANFGSLLRSLENLVVGLGNLGRAFTGAGLNITQWLETMSQRFRTWAASLMGNDSLGGFTDYFQRTWPRLKALVVEFATALAHLLKAVAPLSAAFAELLTGLLRGFNSIPISVLTNLLKTFVALKAAAYGFAAAQVAVNVAMRANPIMLVVTAIAALGAAFVSAYRNSREFRNAVDQAFRDISKAAREMKAAVQPVIDWFKSPQGTKAMSFAMDVVVKDIQVSARGIVLALENIRRVVGAVVDFFGQHMRTMQANFRATQNVVSSVANALIGAFNRVRTGFQALGALISSVGSRITGVFQNLRAAWNTTLGVLQRAPNFGWVSGALSLLGRLISVAYNVASALRAIASAAASISIPNLSGLSFLPGFASGGRPAVGQPALVGEEGPEIFIPDRPGTIVPANETARLMASGSSPVGGRHTVDDLVASQTAVLAELAAIRELLARIPRMYLQQQRQAFGGA